MKRLSVIFAASLISTMALSEEQKAPAVDMGKSITLTLAELQAIIAAERAQVMAAPAMSKVQAALNASRVDQGHGK